MAKYRVTTYYTACIDTDVIACSEKEAIHQVQFDEKEQTQEELRCLLDDIQESWVEHRKVHKVTK